MKKILLIITTVLLAVVSIQAQSGLVVNKSGPYYVGDKIGFNKICHDFSRGTSTWNFSDGTTITYPDDLDHGWQYHSYDMPGTYIVKYTHGTAFSTPMCGVSMAPFTETYQIKIEAIRAVTAIPAAPKVDQQVYFQALNFITPSIYWDLGDGTQSWGGHTFIHRYPNTGVYTVSVREKDIKHDPVTTIVSVAPDDRFIQVSSSEIRKGNPVTVSAFNFIGDSILWNFGDGTETIGGHTVTHIFNSPGSFTITAIDEGGSSSKFYQTQIKVFGISDTVELEVGELMFDNGKYFMITSKNSRELRPLLKLKMQGTGVITGYWVVDGAPYGFINELSRMGEVKEITTDRARPLPTIDPGIHTVSFRLTTPATEAVFPTLKYYVLPYEKTLDIISPPDGFVAKENEIPEFSWTAIKGGAAKYQIAFSASIFDLLDDKKNIIWTDVHGDNRFIPGKNIWDGLKRNRWTGWKVRALDSFNNVTGESGINEIKVIVATAEITLDTITDLDGNDIVIGSSGIKTTSDMILVKGSVTYKGDSEYLILQVLMEDSLVDQLLFRNVKKDEARRFETSIPSGSKGKILFRVLKSSSPSVIVGIKGILIR